MEIEADQTHVPELLEGFGLIQSNIVKTPRVLKESKRQRFGAAAPLIAHGLFEREGSCFAKRSWQEHSSYADEDAMATGTCSSKTLASCESGNGIKSCTWEIES